MIKDSLLEIVDLQFEKKHKNIGIYGQNLTTRALEIYNEHKPIRLLLCYRKVKLRLKSYLQF